MTEANPPTEDDRALSALLDDALPPDEAQRLRRRLADEPELARRLEELRRVDRTVQATYAGIADEPLPQRVVDLLRPPAGIRRLRPRATTSRRPGAGVRPALTAGLALAAGFVLALLVLPRTPPFDPLRSIAHGGTVDVGSSLYRVLQTVPSSQTRALGEGWSATPRLTFLGAAGEPCRRVDLAGADGGLETLACRGENGWRMEAVAFGAAGVAGPDGLYRPAGAGERSGIDGAIDALIASPPLGREAELELISRGWQPAEP